MKFFKSLNCIVCEAPFARFANQSRSPRHLGCGKAMCHECFEREKSTKKAERKHQCEYSDKCFKNPNFAYFLIDVLAQESLKLAPMDLGYLLCKPFKLAECPICHDKYSIDIKGKSSFPLHCNHIICTSCYQKTRTLNEGLDRDTCKYSIDCPICKECTNLDADKRKDRFQDVMAELSEMTRQLEEMNATKYRFCKQCNKLDTIGEMFYCVECIMNICGTCAHKNHRTHKTITLLEMEAYEMSDELQQLSINEVNTYKKLFPQLHIELVDGIGKFETKLLSKEENLKKAPNFEDLKKEYLECIKFKTDFESICEEYMPYLRRCDSKIKDLVQGLENDPK